MEAVDVISRFVHVWVAILLVGGAAFSRIAVLPTLNELGEAERDALRLKIHGRWKKVVHGGIALLLITGFYNMMTVQPKDSLYHALIGVKMLLAFGLFFLASALIGKSAAFEGLRKNAKLWLAVVLLIAAVIVGIAGFLNVRRSAAASADSAAQPVNSLQSFA